MSKEPGICYRKLRVVRKIDFFENVQFCIFVNFIISLSLIFKLLFGICYFINDKIYFINLKQIYFKRLRYATV